MTCNGPTTIEDCSNLCNGGDCGFDRCDESCGQGDNPPCVYTPCSGINPDEDGGFPYEGGGYEDPPPGAND